MEPLVKRYQPTTIEGFAGLTRVKTILAAFAADPYPAAFLCVGNSGTGKTAMGLALADAIDAEVQHVPSRQCDLETVQRAVSNCHYTPLFGNATRHMVLVDEMDQASKPAQHAFLSVLDTTGFPDNTVFWFTCNSTATLEYRFLSRCRTLKFTTDDMMEPAVKLLRKVWRKEIEDRRDRRKKMPEPPDFAAMLRETRLNVREALGLLELELLAPGSFEPTLPDPSVAATKKRAGAPIYSIGYHALSVPALTEALDTLGVSLLIDVRATPQSRLPGFTQGAPAARWRWCSGDGKSLALPLCREGSTSALKPRGTPAKRARPLSAWPHGRPGGPRPTGTAGRRSSPLWKEEIVA